MIKMRIAYICIQSNALDSIASGCPDERMAFTSRSLLALPVTKTAGVREHINHYKMREKMRTEWFCRHDGLQWKRKLL